MELPKNITQVGEPDRYCKVYMEDYVISYIKQINHLAEEQKKAVAFYGKRKTEGESSYVFCYGACQIRTVQTQVRHLSQAQQQEIEKLRQRYFPELVFCGYKLLDGEPVEGFFICDQEICRYVSGYACFYEKNDAMLAYMLDTRVEDAEPEKVDLEKFERARQRQEERRTQSEQRKGFRPWEERKEWAEDSGKIEEAKERERDQEHEESRKNQKSELAEDLRVEQNGYGPHDTWKREEGPEEKEDRLKESREEKKEKAGKKGKTPGLGMMRVSVAGMFAMVCVLGAATLNEYGRLDALKTAAENLLADFTEKKLPEDVPANASAGTLVTQDKLAEAISEENQTGSKEGTGVEEAGKEENGTEETGTEKEDLETKEDPQKEEMAPAGEESTGENAGTENRKAEENQETADTGTVVGDASEAVGTALSEGESTGIEASSGNDGEVANTEGSSGSDGEMANAQVSVPISYTIQKGDTLTSISMKYYGTKDKVKEICAYNNITDPDDIRYGQKILIP